MSSVSSTNFYWAEYLSLNNSLDALVNRTSLGPVKQKCIICTTIHTANSLLTCIYDVCDHNNWYKVVVVVLCGSQFFRVRIKTGIWDACMLQNICPTECTTSETVAYLTRWLQEHFFCVQDVCGAISMSKNTWRMGTWSSCIRLANVVQF